MRRTRIRLSVAVAALLLSVGVAPSSAQATATDTTSRSAAPAQELVPFTVMTYNIRHGIPCTDRNEDLRCDDDPLPPPNLAAIAETILEADALLGLDVVALQEVSQFHADRGCVDQLARITQILSERMGVDWNAEMGRNRAESTAGTACEDESPWAYGGNAILSRHEVNSPVNTPLPREADGTTPRSCPVFPPTPAPQRCVLTALVRLPTIGNVVVHTTHLAAGQGQQPVREAQVNRLLEALPPSPDVPTVLAGDFNLQPQSRLHSRIESSGYIDSWKEVFGDGGECGTAGIFGCTHTSVDPDKRIDYIFHNSRIPEINYATINQSNSSDHFPVAIDFGFNP